MPAPLRSPLRIVYLSVGFDKQSLMEANRREAWTLYSALLPRSPGAEFIFASIEPDLERVHFDAARQVLFLPERDVARQIGNLSPGLLHIFSPDLRFPFSYALSGFRTVLTVTASDPTRGCTPEQLEEARHLIDVGLLTLVPESEASQRLLDQADLKSHSIIPPVVPRPGPSVPSKREPRAFTLGFATAPFFRAHWENRGVALLLDLAARVPDVQFLLAWRCDPREIQEEIARRSLANVRVRAGYLDMEVFYADVDAMIFPFALQWENHTSPLSAVEGMLRERPVLATHHLGIAGWIEAQGAGVITDAEPESLAAGLRSLQKGVSEYGTQASLSAARRFDMEAGVSSYGQLYAQFTRMPAGPTLAEWSSALESQGRVLARGRKAIHAYYTNPQVASGYTKNRFAGQPWQQLDTDERQAVGAMIEARFPGRGDLKLLDLAAGEGRLLRVIARYGESTALDGSKEMLDLAHQQTSQSIHFILGDVFETPIAERFHVITCGRFLRHLEYPDRRSLYRRLLALLREDGVAILEIPNRSVDLEIRGLTGWGKYPVYDVMWSLPDFRDEIRENGLLLSNFAAIGRGVQVHEKQTRSQEPLFYVAELSPSAVAGTSASGPGRRRRAYRTPQLEAPALAGR